MWRAHRAVEQGCVAGLCSGAVEELHGYGVGLWSKEPCLERAVEQIQQSCGVGLWNHGEQGLRSRAVQQWSRDVEQS